MVAELVPAVVGWASGPMAAIFGDSLDDPRVSVREIDVAEMIKSRPQKFDAILLDVDNGPQGLTRQANDALYGPAGLKAAYEAGVKIAVGTEDDECPAVHGLEHVGSETAAPDLEVFSRREFHPCSHCGVVVQMVDLNY